MNIQHYHYIEYNYIIKVQMLVFYIELKEVSVFIGQKDSYEQSNIINSMGLARIK